MALARWSGGICSMRSICLGCSFIWFSLTCSHPTFEPTAKTRTQAMMALMRKAIHQAVPRRMSVKVFAGSKKVLAMRSGCESSGFSATTVVGIVPMGVSPIVSLSAAGLYRAVARFQQLVTRFVAPIRKQAADEHAEDGEQQRCPKRRPEAVDFDTRQQIGRKHQHERVDDQQEDAKRDD